MSLLEFRDVTKRLLDGVHQVAVLDHVSFELHAGETVGVLASRGSGRSMLLRVAAGLETPDEGEVLWEGEDLVALSADQRARLRRRGGIALARGDWRASDSISVAKHVAMPLYSQGMSMQRAETSAHRSLEMVRAPALGYLTTDRLGLAERVRVELARAVVRRPRLLLVDEPAVLPQTEEAKELYSLLQSLPQQLGLTLLIASEDVAALRGAGRVMNLDNGRLYSTDSRRKVIRFPGRRDMGGSSGEGA
jgi:predicted ABC-type transport system involved in lysophospholipase L1 biosynthesis ATPase subunit